MPPLRNLSTNAVDKPKEKCRPVARVHADNAIERRPSQHAQRTEYIADPFRVGWRSDTKPERLSASESRPEWPGYLRCTAITSCYYRPAVQRVPLLTPSASSLPSVEIPLALLALSVLPSYRR